MGGWLRRRRRRVWAGVLVGAALALLAWVRCGPLPPDLLDEGRHLSARVVDRHGEVLYESLSGAGGRSRWLAAPDALPPMVVKATLAAEDRRFFRHPGVDPLAVMRAAWDDARAFRIVEGGSTLTQQVVKRLTARRRTVPGKLREMLLALRLEHRLSKREILALYLNLAPYGNQYAGVAGASRGYFGCPPENLTAAQAAFLAGLPQRPSAFDPYRHVDRALR
ncbi:MAG: biosynthetic peptidoglycan transglycosylase, partial [Acidobacteriota bacterium]